MEATNRNAPAAASSIDSAKPIGKFLDPMHALHPEPLSPEAASHRDRLIIQERERQQQRERSRRTTTSDFLRTVGETYRDCRFENYKTKIVEQVNAVKALQEYVSEFEAFDRVPNILLFGPVGTGKDHLAIATAVSLLQRMPINIEWANGDDLFGSIRDAMDSGDSERQLVADFARPTILILSDPAPPFGELGQHMMGMFRRIVDARLRAGRATWVTINARDDADADGSIGEAAWDRLCDGAWKIRCAWPSHRKPARTINPQKTIKESIDA